MTYRHRDGMLELVNGMDAGENPITNVGSVHTNSEHIAEQLDIPVYSTDADAPTRTHFFNDADSELKYKDASGVVHVPAGDGDDVSNHHIERISVGDDAKPIIQNADPGTLVRYAQGVHRQAGDYDITVPDGVGVQIPAGTTVEAPDISGYATATHGDRPKLFRLYGDGSAIFGKGTVDCRRATNPILQQEHDDANGGHGHEHHIDINGDNAADKTTIRNVYVGGLTLINGMGGDAVYLNDVENAEIENLRIDWMYRNGFAMASELVDITVRRVTVENTAGRHPYGFDIEPFGARYLENVRFENCRAVNNDWDGMVIAPQERDETGWERFDIHVDGFYSEGNRRGFHTGRCALANAPMISVKNLTCRGNRNEGILLGQNIHFEDVRCIGNGTDDTTTLGSAGIRSSADQSAQIPAPENIRIEGYESHPGENGDQATPITLYWGEIMVDGAHIRSGHSNMQITTENDATLYYGSVTREDGLRGESDIFWIRDTSTIVSMTDVV